MNRKTKMETRSAEAIARAEERGKRSAKEQLALLDHRLGVGIGAVKARNRLGEKGDPK